MKRFFLLLLALFLLMSTTACVIQSRQENVLHSLGTYVEKQFWTHGSFQDYTDFGKYSYSSVNIDANNYFTPVSDADIETISAFIDNFEGWIDTFRNSNSNDELVLNYSFDRSIMDTTDYFYIYTGEYDSEFACYDVWFFDSQTNMLYYFHNNI